MAEPSSLPDRAKHEIFLSHLDVLGRAGVLDPAVQRGDPVASGRHGGSVDDEEQDGGGHKEDQSHLGNNVNNLKKYLCF